MNYINLSLLDGVVVEFKAVVVRVEGVVETVTVDDLLVVTNEVVDVD